MQRRSETAYWFVPLAPLASTPLPTARTLRSVMLGRHADEWPTIARAEEKAGLPRISVQYGGRYWPAVKAFYDRRHRLLELQSDDHDDEREKENWDAIPSRRARP